MSEVTLEDIAKILRTELDAQLEPIETKLENLKQTLDGHTVMLDTILKNTTDK